MGIRSTRVTFNKSPLARDASIAAQYVHAQLLLIPLDGQQLPLQLQLPLRFLHELVSAAIKMPTNHQMVNGHVSVTHTQHPTNTDEHTVARAHTRTRSSSSDLAFRDASSSAVTFNSEAFRMQRWSIMNQHIVLFSQTSYPSKQFTLCCLRLPLCFLFHAGSLLL